MEQFDKQIGDAIEFLNSPVADEEVADVILRLRLLTDATGTSRAAVTVLERLSRERAAMAERVAAWSRALREWSDEPPKS